MPNTAGNDTYTLLMQRAKRVDCLPQQQIVHVSDKISPKQKPDALSSEGRVRYANLRWAWLQLLDYWASREVGK